MTYKELVSRATWLISESGRTAKSEKVKTAYRRIIQNHWELQASSTAYQINSSTVSPSSWPFQSIVKGLSPDEQSSFRWDEYKAGNTVKRLKTTTTRKQDVKCGKYYKMLTINRVAVSQDRGKDWNQMRPDERKNKLKIYWRQQKMHETRIEWHGVGAGHIQRHFCVHFSLISLCYKKYLFYSSGELNRSILFYQNIHVLNVKWI